MIMENWILVGNKYYPQLSDQMFSRSVTYVGYLAISYEVPHTCFQLPDTGNR